MKNLLFAAIILLTGCLATENRKVVITQRGVAAVSTSCWWRASTVGVEDSKNPWLKHVPAPAVDETAEQLKYFEKNVVQWPDEMKKPVPDGVIRMKIKLTQEELRRLLRKIKKQQGQSIPRSREVY